MKISLSKISVIITIRDQENKFDQNYHLNTILEILAVNKRKIHSY